MLHIGIVEDLPQDSALLKDAILRYMGEREQPVKVREFSNGDSLLGEWNESIEILFMDIQMEGKNGMETAGILRKKKSRVQIIFVTNMPVFALESYSVHASGFLTKPVSIAEVYRELDKALYRLSIQPDRVWTVRHTEGIRIIPIQDIVYIETWKHKLLIHLKGEAIPCFGTLQKAEEEIRLPSFFRCHSSYLIHLKYVERLEGVQVKLAGEYVPVSRHRRKELSRRLMEYLEENL